MINNDEASYDPKSSVYTPTQAATYALNAARQAHKSFTEGTGIGIPIAKIKDYIPPVLPGQVMAIIAQTSNYKSGFMHFMEHEAANRLTELGHEKDILIHVSVEEGIEEQGFLEVGRLAGMDAGEIARGSVQDWSKLEEAAIKVGSIPIYRIGDSLARSDDMPLLHVSNMIRSIDALVNGDVLDWRPHVAGIFFDYLQAFPIDPEFRNTSHDQQRRLQVRSDIYRIRQCAAKYQCPCFVAVQAKQHLEGARHPVYLPGIYDGNESADIAQRCDRIITLWMPKSHFASGEFFDHRGKQYSVEDSDLWIKCAKQRGRLPSGEIWQTRIDFIKNTVVLVDDQVSGRTA